MSNRPWDMISRHEVYKYKKGSLGLGKGPVANIITSHNMAFFSLQTEEKRLHERAQRTDNGVCLASFRVYFISIEVKSQQIGEKICQGLQLRCLHSYKTVLYVSLGLCSEQFIKYGMSWGNWCIGKSRRQRGWHFQQDSDCWETNPHALFHVSLICVLAWKCWACCGKPIFFFWIFYLGLHPMLKGKDIKNEYYPYLS